MKQVVVLVICVFMLTSCSNGQPVLDKNKIIADMKRVANYELKNPSVHDHNLKYDYKNGWIPATFYMGLVPLYEVSKDVKYLNAVKEWGNSFDWECAPRLHHADDIVCGQVFLDLYRHDRDYTYVQKLVARMDSVIVKAKPGREEWSWCDALFMAPPTYIMANKILDQPKYLNFADTMYWDVYNYLFDKTDSLFYRDKKFFTQKSPNGEKMYWGRGNGWVLAGLAKMIPYVSDQKLKANYINLYKLMTERIVQLQQNDGLWRTNLLDPEHYNQKETSGSAFYIYSIAWGINYGILDKDKYQPVVEKGWKAISDCIDEETGRLGYVQPIGAAPDATTESTTFSYGAGAYLLAGVELVNLIDKNN